MNPCTHDRERGIALILVLVILPLVAILMTQLHFETAIGDRLASNVLAMQQFKQAIRAREVQMRLKLVRDLEDDEQNKEQGASDSYADIWGPDTEGGHTASSVSKGDEETGDVITLYTAVTDEQSKFNLNLIRHTDPRRRARAKEVFRTLLDLYRDARYNDLASSEWDLDEQQATEVSDAVFKFIEGEERDEKLPKPQIPDPAPDMKQGVYTVQDLIFCHPLFQEKRILETFTDTASGQMIPGLDRFLTVHGDGKVNANTAPIQLLRALFREEEGRTAVAEAILTGRGGFLQNEDGEEKRKEKAREREDARQRGDEEKLDELNAAYTSVNDLTKVEGLNDPGFLRRNEIDLGQTFTVRTSFFSLVITARRDTFLRQQRLVLERHAAGCITHEAEVRAVDMADVPSEGTGTADGSAPPPGT